MYCSPTVGLQAYREKELQTESEYDIIMLIDVESTVMWSTWNFWMLRPFRPLKMSAAQGFVRVRISKFHIVLACFSCILPEQGLHLRYTESCPRGRRCDTRNFGGICEFRPPDSPWYSSTQKISKSNIFCRLSCFLSNEFLSKFLERKPDENRHGELSEWSKVQHSKCCRPKGL